MLAYLVIREGSKWTDVFRLVPGRTVTVGRASTNQIVVKDERCSRNHAEIFHSRGRWTVRDLDSRNGTLVAGQAVRGDYELTPGEVIRIANCQMAFVEDLSQAFAEQGPDRVPHEDETVSGGTFVSLSDSHVLDDLGGEGTQITHRRGETKLLKALESKDIAATPKLGQASAQLCQLAFKLANLTEAKTVAQTCLDGLFEGTGADAGAVLLATRTSEEDEPPQEFAVVASRSKTESSYHKVSTFLATTVQRDGEGVLARNILDDSTLGSRDSKGVIHTTSVICAPVRQDGQVVGLLHLYSTDVERMLDPEDLEFTLAVGDILALALKNLSRQQEMTENLTQKQSEIVQLRNRLGVESELVGSSAGLAKVQQEVERAAPSRATVLIRGESGSGKELVARAIHFSSPRKKGPFVCMNCAALSETLLESELFGHERGAFTGATERKIGKFEAAHLGTLMMDEIGEMSPSIQAKFLRVLEGHPFERVGGSKAIKVDVRVIAATNRDLERAVAEGKFRRDLYFRLHVVEIYVPPLRKRPEDVLELAYHFLDKFNTETGRKLRGYTPAGLERLREYRWPGNVRELKNVVERAVVLSRGEFIDVDDLTLSSLLPASESSEILPPKNTFEPLSLDEIERRHISQTLNSTGWNKSRSATILGIERSTLDRKIQRYKLAPKGGEATRSEEVDNGS